MSWFSDMFAVDEALDVDTRVKDVAKASEVLDVADRPYFVRLVQYLRDESDKPVLLGEKMLESAVEANTYKKVMAKIRRDIREAKSLLEEVKHGR